MPDDKTKKHPHDGKRIDVNDINELVYWTLELGITDKQLIDAVKELGTSASVIRKRFGK